MFEIHELLEATHGKLVVSGKKNRVMGISLDSRTIRPDEAFIAIKGDNFDGHDFIHTAIKKKAACIIKERGKTRFGSEEKNKTSLNADFRKSNADIRRFILRDNLRPSACNLQESALKNAFSEVAIIDVQDTTKALGDIANFHRKKFDIPLIAITGSTGKTTTKEMLAWILSFKFKVLKNEGTKNNHIGLPQTLLGLRRDYDIAIVELGTNHFGEIETLAEICQPNIGIITNIGPSHLEYFGDLKGVFHEKYSLVKNLKQPSIAILNADDRFLRMRLKAKERPLFMLGFGIKNHCEFPASAIKDASGGLEFCVKKHKFILKTLGFYNIYNALAAIACGYTFGMKYKDMAGRLGNFEFPEGRLKLRELKQKRFIDDTYNSNPASLKQALNVLENFKTRGKKIFVMGDMLELGENSGVFHYQAGKLAARSCDKFIAVGKLSRLAIEGAKKSAFEEKNMFSCDTAWEAREILFKDIAPDKDDIILVKGSRAMKMEEIFNIP